MMEPDDQTLLMQIRRRDQQALEQLYARYRVRLYGYLFHQLDESGSWAEEIVQDVFFSVWQSAHSYRGEAQVGTWLFRIAHHMASTAKRNQSRRAEGHLVENARDTLVHAETHELENENSSWVASPENMIVERLALADVFYRLSSKHRTALELVYYHGFSLNEVAHILDVPVGTIKSRVNYARRELSLLLRQAEEGEELRHGR